jgi:hypothetical protein
MPFPQHVQTLEPRRQSKALVWSHLLISSDPMICPRYVKSPPDERYLPPDSSD